MEEISVGDLAACRGESGTSTTYIAGRRGFEPFVDERGDRDENDEGTGQTFWVI